MFLSALTPLGTARQQAERCYFHRVSPHAPQLAHEATSLASYADGSRREGMLSGHCSCLPFSPLSPLAYCGAAEAHPAQTRAPCSPTPCLLLPCAAHPLHSPAPPRHPPTSPPQLNLTHSTPPNTTHHHSPTPTRSPPGHHSPRHTTLPPHSPPPPQVRPFSPLPTPPQVGMLLESTRFLCGDIALAKVGHLPAPVLPLLLLHGRFTTTSSAVRLMPTITFGTPPAIPTIIVATENVLFYTSTGPEPYAILCWSSVWRETGNGIYRAAAGATP